MNNSINVRIRIRKLLVGSVCVAIIFFLFAKINTEVRALKLLEFVAIIILAVIAYRNLSYYFSNLHGEWQQRFGSVFFKSNREDYMGILNKKRHFDDFEDFD